MPLEEISYNKVAIPRAQSLPNAPKGSSRGAPKGHRRRTNDQENNTPARQTPWTAKIAIVTARLLYKETWDQIVERLKPMEIKRSTAAAIYRKAWEVEKKERFEYNHQAPQSRWKTWP